MKRTIYIINAILFMGCCLLVSTTTPDVKDIDVNNKITYVNSDAITKEEVIEVAPVEVVEEVVEKEPVVVEEKVEEEVIEEEPEEEVVVGKDEVIEDNTPIDSKPDEEVYIPSITVGSTFTGTMSGYGADIGNYTASGHYIGDSIYYPDSTYGDIRILAGDRSIPFGTVIEVSNSNVGSFIGIVLDTGRNIGFDKLYDFDVLFETSREALNYGVSKNVSFKILRVGY
ncbi:MAG TPA: hypothetical protein IAB38_04970 [Candidatus Onthousia excrementipullorum]|uniref:3D domain-containing protein n=1 Tax=Candidatus Onthousia excrementipullorum TaxID=2840884 RepID=A0A9D1DUI7_9FIRM|nr:hypothetical protein [Candidatus Onthousia excrementipullorum]